MIPTLVTQRRIEAEWKHRFARKSFARAVRICEFDPNEENRDAVLDGIDKLDGAQAEVEEWNCETEGLI